MTREERHAKHFPKLTMPAQDCWVCLAQEREEVERGVPASTPILAWSDPAGGYPPINLATGMLMKIALTPVKTLEAAGIYPVTQWRLVGRCTRGSSHGVSSVYIETTDKFPTQPWTVCTICRHKAPVEEVHQMTNFKLPQVGGKRD